MESSKKHEKSRSKRRPKLNLSHGASASGGKSGTQDSGSKSGKASKTSDPGNNRPCPEHSFLTDVADVRQMEHGLIQLLDDFHSGKLQAFGDDCMFDKMDQIREQQEHLARLHFDLDSQQEIRGKGLDSVEEREQTTKNMERLMDNLQELCLSIQNLQKDDAGSVTDATT